MLEQGNAYDEFRACDIDLRMIQGHFSNSSDFYRNEKYYAKLQKMLQNGDFNLNFINADISEFSKKLDGKFDVIMLSNIFDYVDSRDFYWYLSDIYNNNLNKNGTIQLYYSFSPRNVHYFREKFQGGFKVKEIDYCMTTAHVINECDNQM